VRPAAKREPDFANEIRTELLSAEAVEFVVPGVRRGPRVVDIGGTTRFSSVRGSTGLLKTPDDLRHVRVQQRPGALHQHGRSVKNH
jgi:hypothetical protein